MPTNKVSVAERNVTEFHESVSNFESQPEMNSRSPLQSSTSVCGPPDLLISHKPQAITPMSVLFSPKSA